MLGDGGDNDGLRAFWRSETCGESCAFSRMICGRWMNGGGHHQVIPQ
jgi:hypothetical protein